jgi:flavin reductase (DIM6/NTAB) family NADH-FMN oxidoreductase RutF
MPSSSLAAGAAAERPELAAALGRIPSGLFVITWRQEQADQCMLASWVMQAGFEPPAISVAVGTSRAFRDFAEDGGLFVVNVLSHAQRSLLSRFGRPSAPGEDVLAGLVAARSPGEAAILPNIAAWLECRASGVSTPRADQSTDHIVIVASVTAGGGDGGEPLVHLRKNGLRY